MSDSSLAAEIERLLGVCAFDVPSSRERIATKLREGRLIRADDAGHHFCVMFVPYNPATGEFFIVHHRKARLWLSPGGHIEAGEMPSDTLRREVREELGCEPESLTTAEPFMLSAADIDDPARLCRTHFDIWYALPADGRDFSPDPGEFIETRWVTLGEAKRIVPFADDVKALEIVARRYA